LGKSILGVIAVHGMNAVAASSSSVFSALIWWLIPFFAVLGAIIYVTWVAKFKDKYANETNRSVTKFQSFQDSFRDDSSTNT
jgi:uncharacterized Tic20 family protein